MPSPPSSSPCTAARMTSPRSTTPAAPHRSTAPRPAIRPAFMSQAPRPRDVRRADRRGERRVAHASGSPVGTTSTCPFSISVAPSPVPGCARRAPTLRDDRPPCRGSRDGRSARRGRRASGRRRSRCRPKSVGQQLLDLVLGVAAADAGDPDELGDLVEQCWHGRVDRSEDTTGDVTHSASSQVSRRRSFVGPAELVRVG